MIQKIWANTFLKKLYSTDRKFAIGLTTIIVIYAFIHIAKVELYPFSLFAMFSTPAPETTEIIVYEFSKEGSKNPPSIQTRKFLKMYNTIRQYNEITSNNYYHPEAKTIEKIRSKTVDIPVFDFWITPHYYDENSFNDEMNVYLKEHIDNDITISRNVYNWNEDRPELASQKLVFE